MTLDSTEAFGRCQDLSKGSSLSRWQAFCARYPRKDGDGTVERCVNRNYSSIDSQLNLYRNRISSSNWQNSPLLRLPGEIRNQIYKSALGGRAIHIHSVKDLMRRTKFKKWEGAIPDIARSYGLDWNTFCEHQRSSWDDMYIQAVRLENLGQRNSFVRRISCRNPQHDRLDISTMSPLDRSLYKESDSCRNRQWRYDMSKGLWRVFSLDNGCCGYCCTAAPNMAILATCRAIYGEAALVPYCSSTFVFQMPGDLDDFVRRGLTSKQAAALTRAWIVIPGQTTPHSRFLGDREILRNYGFQTTLLKRSTAEMMTGLRHLTLSFSADGGPSAETEPWAIPILPQLKTVRVTIGKYEARSRNAELIQHVINRKEFIHFHLTKDGGIVCRKANLSRTGRLRYAFERVRHPL